MAIAMLLMFLPFISALDNGFNRPAMGFNPWNCFGVGRSGAWKLNVSWTHGFNDSVIRAVADAMDSNGLRAAGYEYVGLDCGWTTGFRNPKTHKQIVNKTRYPHGIQNLADYVHSRGLKFGIYTSASTSQCCSGFYAGANDGSLDYETIDAEMYASFGVDYLKFDGCDPEQRSYPAMRDALNRTGRPVLLSVNGFNISNVQHAGKFANSWRTGGDDNDSLLNSLAPRIFKNNEFASYARPGQYNDPDMLEVGNMAMLGNVTDARAHFSLWCISKAPLIIGTDVTNITQESLQILTNKEAIAVNQDELSIQGRVVWRSKAELPPKKWFPPVPLQSVWAGPLVDGAYAVLFFNTDETSATIKLTSSMLKQAATWASDGRMADTNSLRIRDLWGHTDLGMFDGEFSAKVESHGVLFMSLKPIANQSRS